MGHAGEAVAVGGAAEVMPLGDITSASWRWLMKWIVTRSPGAGLGIGIFFFFWQPIWSEQ